MIATSVSLMYIISQLSACKYKANRHYYLQACGKSVENSTLVLTDTLRLKVDSVTSSQHYYDQLQIINGKPHYLIMNLNFGIIYVYDLEAKKTIHKIHFQKEGPEGIGAPHRFYYHNNDSIFFIYYEYFKKILLYNGAGNRINSWQIELPSPYESNWLNGDLFYEFKFNAKEKTVGFWISYGMVHWKSYPETVVQCRYNIVENTFRFFGELPYELLSQNYYPHNYINGYTAVEKFICYYLPSHEVQVYNNKEILPERRIKIKSRFLPEVIPPLIAGSENPSLQEEHNYNLENGFYVKMFSNEEGTYHYRIVKHPVKTRYADGRARNFYDKPFSVMLLDKDLNQIEEIAFAGGQYDFFHSIAYANKLYLSLNNPLNAIFSDEEIIFAVYEVRRY